MTVVYHNENIMVIEPNKQEKTSTLGDSAGRRKEVNPVKTQVPHDISEVLQNLTDWGMLWHPVQSKGQIICILSTPKKEAQLLVTPLIALGSL